MNNKFIPIISVFMTISLVVFVALQFYWLKSYYEALEQDFSNKVDEALESSAKKMTELDVEKYYAQYKNLNKYVMESTQPSVTAIQQVEDSASRRNITYYKNIIENKDIPISQRGDSLKVTTMYTDEA